MAGSKGEKRKIGVKEAVQAAMAAIGDLLPSADISDLRLEEVEQSEDERYWLITLGFYVVNQLGEGPVASAILAPPMYVRKYKVFKIDATSGKVISMKIREVSGV